ncbi:MAG: lipopolysaccharide biosynthesis protein [Rhodocyclaceae bacterium]|nr:lipopolysaccharide biosynthesis protein [Rhodocyclaceae bacterium]
MASVRKALLLTVASNGTGIALQMVVIVVLSRLLTPAEVGVYSVAAVLTGLAGVLRDFGVGEYLIQEKDLTDEKIRAAITANIAVSWTVCIVLFLLARPMSVFYAETGVGNVLEVLALGFLVTPFGAVAMAFLRREMRFHAMYWATLVSGVGSGAVAIILAYRGFGYMSLAWSSLVSSMLIVVVSLVLRPAHLPFWPGFKGLRQVLHFGTHMTGTYLFAHIGRGAPDLVIGRMIDMQGVGLFSRAGGALELIHRFVLRGIRPVMLPYFSAQRRAGAELKQGYLRGVALVTGVTWPVIAILGLMAYPAIRLLYGQQWLASVPLMQVLCAALAIEIVFLTASEILIAAGRVASSSRLQLVTQSIRIAAIIGSAAFGLLAVSLALLAAAVVNAGITIAALHRAIDMNRSDLFAACGPSLAPTLVAALPSVGVLAWAGVGEENFVAAALFSGILGAAAWLASVIWLRHPLGLEVVGAWHRLRGREG